MNGHLVYVAGGTGPEGDACPEVLRFNTLSHRWEDGDSALPAPQPMPTPRFGHEVVAVLGRYLLCIGGKAAAARDLPEGRDELVATSADVLDVLTGRWVALPCRLAQPRVYFGAAVVTCPTTQCAVVVVSGGMEMGGFLQQTSAEGRLASTELLDVSGVPGLFSGDDSCAPLAWQPGPPLLRPRYDFSLAGPAAGRLYAVGGSGARQCVEVLEVSDLPRLCCEAVPAGASAELPRWEVHPVELPESRSSALTVALGDRLLFVGGSQKLVYCLGPTSGDAEGDGAGGLGPLGRWSPLRGAELDSLRLGAKVVAFGSRTLPVAVASTVATVTAFRQEALK